MNLEGKINVIKTAKDNIKSAIIAKGVVPSGNISTYASAISEIDTTNNTNLTVNPSTTTQTFTVSGQYTGYETVKVNGVTASIDNDIKASNIKSGVNILGVTGNVVELQGEVKTETLSSVNGNTYVPSSGANGITSIKVNPKNMGLTITPSTTEVIRTVPSGYSGHGNVKVEAVTASIDSNIQAGNIKQGVSILGVNGNMVGLEGQTKTVIPTTTTQNIVPDNGKNGLTTVTVNGVDASIDSNIKASNIKKDVAILGVTGTLETGGSTPTGTLSITQNGIYDVTNYASASVSVGGGIDGKYGATASTFLGDVNANGVLQMPTRETNLVFTGVRDIGDIVLQSFAYGYNNRNLNNIKTVSFPDLTTISGSYAMNSAFYGCTGLTSVDLSSLTTVSGNQAMSSAFQGCTGLTSVDLSSLTTVSGNQAMSSAFRNCTKLKTLSFPSLTSTSFGSNTNQFNNMLSGVTGCTVHFPSNLQSKIGSWSSVTSGFGGTNTTVLFDLPATT